MAVESMAPDWEFDRFDDGSQSELLGPVLFCRDTAKLFKLSVLAYCSGS